MNVLAVSSLQGYSFVHLTIMAVVIAAIVALVWVALRQFGVAIPAWVQNVFWIVVVAFVVVLAILFVASLL